MKCKIYYSQFDTEEINTKGWGSEEGRLKLHLTDPIENQKTINALGEALEKDKYKLVSELTLPQPQDAWITMQEPSDNRSMQVGDVVICKENRNKIGLIADPIGWTELSDKHIDKFENIK
jgi:hypothetical protein